MKRGKNVGLEWRCLIPSHEMTRMRPRPDCHVEHREFHDLANRADITGTDVAAAWCARMRPQPVSTPAEFENAPP